MSIPPQYQQCEEREEEIDRKPEKDILLQIGQKEIPYSANSKSPALLIFLRYPNGTSSIYIHLTEPQSDVLLVKIYEKKTLTSIYDKEEAVYKRKEGQLNLLHLGLK